MNQINSKPREVYYDVQINNFESTGSASQPLVFNETRSTPIIKSAGDYSLSIVRFQLDTYSLPTFIANIEPTPNTNINKMIETITLEYDHGGVLTEVPAQNLIWRPTNLHVPLPRAPAPLQETQTEYYYGNSFRHYIDLINDALVTATSLLKTAVGASLIDILPPFMIWNEQSQTAELYAQKQYFDNNTNKVNIYFNRALYGKLTSLPATKNFNGSNGKIYKIYMKDDKTTNIVKLDIDGLGEEDYIKTCQEYSTIANWCPTSSIVFTTSTLPIVATQMSAPRVYNNGNSINTSIPQNFAQVKL